jgi:Tfp pilus assembly protein PilV
VRARLRSQEGFGLIELLMAMVMLNIGILAIVAAYQTGTFALNRASKISTASALADQQMELYRAIKYDAIALDSSSLGSSTTRTNATRRSARRARTRRRARPRRRAAARRSRTSACRAAA